jgi:response regulator RpfG family c-di-GMP phosphodiesterase
MDRLEMRPHDYSHLKSGKAAKPCLILIHLNAPIMGGIEALEKIKSDDRLKEIPVIVVTIVLWAVCSARNDECRATTRHERRPPIFLFSGRNAR